MSAAVKPYQPKILTPTLKRRIPGVRVLLIQSERDPNAYHFIGIYPDGYIRCQCEAGRHNRQCKHKLAIIEWLERRQVNEPLLADMSSADLLAANNRRRLRNGLPLLPALPLTKSERRETALLETAPKIEWLGSLPLKAS